EVALALAMDRLQIRASADHLAWMTPGLFEKHRQVASDLAGVERSLLALEKGLQTGEAFGLDRFVNLARQGRGRCSGAAGIFERKGAGERHLFDERQGGLEVGVRLAWEADDEIARKGDVGPRGPDAVQRPQEAFDGVG